VAIAARAAAARATLKAARAAASTVAEDVMARVAAARATAVVARARAKRQLRVTKVRVAAAKGMVAIMVVTTAAAARAMGVAARAVTVVATAAAARAMGVAAGARMGVGYNWAPSSSGYNKWASTCSFWSWDRLDSSGQW